MTIWDRNQLKPSYPVYEGEGVDPFRRPYVAATPDLFPSGWGPGYSVYSSAFGRHLAGVDEVEQPFDGQHAEGIETYPNELDLLTAADDVQGNGVFDPNDTHGNVHPDAGVFQDHLSLPGYVARDHFYELSEVRDLTQPNGEVVYVPGGAVSLQQGQQRTLSQNQALWKLPPGVSPFVPGKIPSESTVDAPTATWPVGQVEAEAPPDYKPYYIAAGVGAALGLALLALRKKKR